MNNVRDLMNQAQDYFRDSQPDCKEERKMLLETWLDIELSQKKKDESNVLQVREKLPIKVKKRRPLQSASNPETETQEGEEIIVAEGGAAESGLDIDMTGWEEFYDYIFPDDDKTGKGKGAKNLKLLEMARKWKS